jgi:hypothetical protein
VTHSDAIDQIGTALAKAQGKIQNVTKDAKNPHFKSDYATLDAITDMVRPVFAEFGLAVVQIPTFADGIVTVETLVTHSSGQWVRGATSAPVSKADAQGVGSATTYLRRYSLAAIAAIAQTDDDGNAASQQPAQRTAAPVKATAPKGYDDWWADIVATADTGMDALRAAWKASKGEYRDYTTSQHNAKWEALKAKAAKIEAVPA